MPIENTNIVLNTSTAASIQQTGLIPIQIDFQFFQQIPTAFQETSGYLRHNLEGLISFILH